MLFWQRVPMALSAVLMVSTSVSFAFDWPCGVYYQKNGPAQADWFGMSVSSAGDVNGDGHDDFIIGAPYADPAAHINAGSIYVYSGFDGALLYQKDGAATMDRFGHSVAGAGDVNNDGYDDFIVGAVETDPGTLIDAGSAYVYSGANGSLLYQKDGGDNGDNLGQSVAGAGDVNSDGYDDFIIGVPLADPGGRPNAGTANVYSGIDGSLLYLNPGFATDDRFGYSVAGAGDINDDGYADFIVGAYAADPDGLMLAGSAYVFSGLTGAPIYKRDGEATGDRFGLPVAGAGDVNADGYDDFIVGANGADPNGIMNAGSAYLYSGQNGSLLYRKDGAAAGDNFGMSAAGAGDVNGDGHDDFVIGALYADPGGVIDAGSAYLYSGVDGSLH
ncbi:MAG TPA: integrin alpha, partial [Acidobacteriota bacterium]|nr:integrin alpha [Acidobacteriota bacterium]